MTDGRDENKWS